MRGILRVKPRSIEPFAEGAPAGERARPRSHAHEGAGGVARTRGPGIPQSYGEGRERRRAELFSEYAVAERLMQIYTSL